MSKTIVYLCPKCRGVVIQTMRYGQRSYDCGTHWGPWSERIREPGEARTHYEII